MAEPVLTFMKSVEAMCPMCGHKQKLTLFGPESTKAYKFKCRECSYVSRVDGGGKQLPDENDEPMPPDLKELGTAMPPWATSYNGEPIADEVTSRKDEAHQTTGKDVRHVHEDTQEDLDRMRNEKEFLDKYSKLKQEVEELENTSADRSKDAMQEGEKRATGKAGKGKEKEHRGDVPVAGLTEDPGKMKEKIGEGKGQYDKEGKGQYDKEGKGQYDKDGKEQYDKDGKGQYDKDGKKQYNGREGPAAAHGPSGETVLPYGPYGQYNKSGAAQPPAGWQGGRGQLYPYDQPGRGVPPGQQYYRPPGFPRDRCKMAGIVFIVGAIFICRISLMIFAVYETDSFGDALGNSDLEITVMDAGSDAALNNSTIILDGMSNQNNTTSEDGKFLFRNVDIGEHDLLVSASGYRTQRYKFFVILPKEGDIELKIRLKEIPPEGDPGKVEEKKGKDYGYGEIVFQQVALGFIGAAAVFVAGIFSLRRQKYVLVMGSSMIVMILAIFSGGSLLFGAIFILPALFFAHKSKPFFMRGRSPRGGYDGPQDPW